MVIARPINGSAIRVPSATTAALATTPSETNESMRRVVPISNECGTVEASPPTQPDSRSDLVCDEPDDACGCEHPEVTQGLRVDESLDGFVQGNERADQDRCDDSESGPALAARGAEIEGDAKRNRREAVAVVVDQVGKERHASRGDEDQRLDRGGGR